jgi:putative oxidoreductase
MTTSADPPSAVERLSPNAFGVFRILFGLLFLMHGTAKLFGFPDGDPVGLFVWPIWWAGIIEIVVGVLVTVGLFTRAAAFVGAGTMAVAYFWKHFPDSFWPSVNGGETAVLFCFVFLLLIVTGPGGVSVSRRQRRTPLGAAPEK